MLIGDPPPVTVPSHSDDETGVHTTLQHTEDQPEAEGADPHYHNVL